LRVFRRLLGVGWWLFLLGRWRSFIWRRLRVFRRLLGVARRLPILSRRLLILGRRLLAAWRWTVGQEFCLFFWRLRSFRGMRGIGSHYIAAIGRG